MTTTIDYQRHLDDSHARYTRAVAVLAHRLRRIADQIETGAGADVLDATTAPAHDVIAHQVNAAKVSSTVLGAVMSEHLTELFYAAHEADALRAEAKRAERAETEATLNAQGVTILVAPSAGSDGAIVVDVTTDFEPDASDGGPGLRVLLNDDTAYAGVPLDIPRST